MTRTIALLLALLLPTLCPAQTGGYRSVVKAMTHRYHAHAHGISMLGMINLFARMETKGSVRGLRITVFENMPPHVDGNEVADLVSTAIGPDWKCMVRTTGRHEQDLLYVQIHGKRAQMVILTLTDHPNNDKQNGLIALSVDPEQLVHRLEQWDQHANSPDNGDEHDNE